MLLRATNTRTFRDVSGNTREHGTYAPPYGVDRSGSRLRGLPYGALEHVRIRVQLSCRPQPAGQGIEARDAHPTCPVARVARR